ncbi:MAG: type II toxin-antitoxin system VapB family antitoxin [Pseudolysinimonas sp.]
MSLNLKDEETVALVTEVAKKLGLTKTGAVRELARERLAVLERAEASDLSARERAITAWLEKDVWPHTVGIRRMTKEEEEALLGYDQISQQ